MKYVTQDDPCDEWDAIVVGLFRRGVTMWIAGCDVHEDTELTAPQS